MCSFSTADDACDPLAIAAICSSNKELRLDLLKLLQKQPLKQAAVLLAGVKEAMRAATASLQERSSQSIWWFLDKVLPKDVADQLLLCPSIISSLVRIPNFPHQASRRPLQARLGCSLP